MNEKNEHYGRGRLEKVLAQNSEKTPAELLPAIKADLDAFVGEAEQFDDITMLCIEFNPKEKRSDISVTPDKDSIKTVTEFIESTLEEWEMPMKVANKVQVAVDEIYSNIVYYSGAKNAKITVTVSDEKLLLLFEDDGTPYDPTTAKEPDVTLSAEERDVGGIFMVKKMAADIHYENTDGKNRLTVVFGVK